MTDDEREQLFADAHAMANWACSDCGRVASPYALVEVRIPDTPVRWLCWRCLPALFGAEDPSP